MQWEKLDKYILTLALVLTLMAVLVIFTFRGVFGAFLTSTDINLSGIEKPVIVDKAMLEDVHNWAFNKPDIKLEITE